jgi:hypothetical protein
MNQSHEKPDLNQYAKTYRETRGRDGFSLLFEAMTTVAGGIVGRFSAQSIAGWFGANITTTTYAAPLTAKILAFLPAGLVKTVGVTATATTTITTPVGWVIGSVVACASIGWAVARLLRSGGIQDERRQSLGRSILEKMERLFHARKQTKTALTQDDLAAQRATVETCLRELAEAGLITAERVEGYIEKLRSGQISLNMAMHVVQEYGKELINPSLNGSADLDTELTKAASARAFTVLQKSVAQSENPGTSYFKTMQTRFGLDESRAMELYRDAPLDNTPERSAEQLRDIFTDAVMQNALSALQETARGMEQGQAAFVRFQQVERILEAQIRDQIGQVDRAGQKAREAIRRL